MDPTILAALIAGGISLLGGVASVLISRNAARNEMDIRVRQLRQENNRTYSEQLLHKRLEIYPDANEIILKFMQDIRQDGMQMEHVSTLRDALRRWEVKHSLLLSYKSRATLSELQKCLRTALRADKPELHVLKSLVDEVGKLRLALKGDLGIFRVEFDNTDDGYFQNYDQLFAHQQKTDQEKEQQAEPQPEDDGPGLDEIQSTIR